MRCLRRSPNIAGRALTALVYLNDGFEGGETSFPTAGLVEPMRNVYRVRERYGGGCQTGEGLAVRPRRGSVVLFYNLEPNSATKDFYSWHGSCDVLHGEKWSANCTASGGRTHNAVAVHQCYRPLR